MTENPQPSPNGADDQASTRLVSRSVAAVVVLLWAITALVLQPGIDFLLLLVVLLCGAGAMVMALLEWQDGRLSSRHMVAMLLVSAPMVVYGGIKLAYLPERTPRFIELLLLVLWLVAINHLRRVSNREKPA